MGDKDREQFDKVQRLRLAPYVLVLQLVSFVVPSLVVPLDAINDTVIQIGAFAVGNTHGDYRVTKRSRGDQL